jgi:L-rhamnose isomerase / sugar isomerase
MCFNSRLTNPQADSIYKALDAFRIELPSWGFANTGTRFGKFLQPAAASTIEEKFSDAGEVHRWTGVCPTLALHVLWDMPGGTGDVAKVGALAAQHGLRPGSINPNTFQDQIYKYGSLGNPDLAVRKQALDHILERTVKLTISAGWPKIGSSLGIFNMFIGNAAPLVNLSL